MLLYFSFLIYHAQSDDCTKDKPFCKSCDSNGRCEQCIMSEVQGSFYLENGNCVSCKPFCFNCTNSDDCIDCFNGYGKDTNGNCVPCEVENCQVCNSSTFCLDCLKETGLSADRDPKSATYGQCVNQKPPNCLITETFDSSRCVRCEDGYYGEEDIYEGEYIIAKCTKCDHENCKRCDYFNCYECLPGYVMDSLSCVQSNIPNCLELDKEGHCSECNNGFLLNKEGSCEKIQTEHCLSMNNGRCLKCDSPDYQIDKETGQCVDCHTFNNCIECNHNNKLIYCNKCLRGYEEYFGLCVPMKTPKNCSYFNTFDLKCTECYDGFHLVEETGACVECEIENCASCQKGTDTCDRCFGDLLVDMDGPSATYGKCVEYRIENCAFCLGSPSICAKCKEGFEYIKTSYCKFVYNAGPTTTVNSPGPASSSISVTNSEQTTTSNSEQNAASNSEQTTVATSGSTAASSIEMMPSESIDEYQSLGPNSMTEEETSKNEGEAYKDDDDDDDGGGISTGGVIGTAFGSAAGGGLITGAASYFYFKILKRKKVTNIGMDDNQSNKEGNEEDEEEEPQNKSSAQNA